MSNIHTTDSQPLQTREKREKELETVFQHTENKIVSQPLHDIVDPTTQLLTYMGNKRKILPYIHQIIQHVAQELNRPISFADPFSGSGVVSRMAIAATECNHIYANDNALYAHICNLCYLKPPTDEHTMQQIRLLVDHANALPDPPIHEQWIARHWAPADDDNIIDGERCYFTRENALRIDAIRNFIDSEHVPIPLKPYLLAPLLIQSSIHNNTNGQFAAFYKNEQGIGAFGGKKAVDTKRITQRIILPYPVWTTVATKNILTSITCKDATEWANDIQTTIDLVYMDPPYNKHPYNIYYFLLDIIAKWDKSIDIPNTYRGQPKNWIRSQFNSSVDAHKAFNTMINNIQARFVALSYYDAGILSIDEIDTILNQYGDVQRFPIDHSSVYGKLHGIGSYKRTTNKETAKEYIWILKKNIH